MSPGARHLDEFIAVPDGTEVAQCPDGRWSMRSVARALARELGRALFPLLAVAGLFLASRGMVKTPVELKSGQELARWSMAPKESLQVSPK